MNPAFNTGMTLNRPLPVVGILLQTTRPPPLIPDSPVEERVHSQVLKATYQKRKSGIEQLVTASRESGVEIHRRC